MRTALISDLHLGLTSGGDVLRDDDVRALLVEEIAGADRVVLLGDVVELREQPLAAALSFAQPFFAELGRALAPGAEVTLVPGNHDHRFAEPLLDGLNLEGRDGLGLEHLAAPSPGPTAAIAAALAPAKLRIAYPGVRVRADVYATHGHYMDAHLTLPRAECLATALIARIRGPVPGEATPADYERLLRPIYGLAYAAAQGRRRPMGHQQRVAESAWEALAGAETEPSPGRRLASSAIRASFPLGVRALNRLLRAEFDADVSAGAIFGGGVEAAARMAERLGVDGGHVITGHSHRGGPTEREARWALAGGGSLHNTGNWVFSSIFHHPGKPPNAYWPGTVTWVEDEGPPRRVQLLLDRSHADLVGMVNRGRL
jgi:predicted phosphodiesterase